MRVPARGYTNAMLVALDDEKNVTSLHLYYSGNLAVLASAIDDVAIITEDGQNTIVVNCVERIPIVDDGVSHLNELGVVNMTLVSTLKCMPGNEHVFYAFKTEFDFTTGDVAAAIAVHLMRQAAFTLTGVGCLPPMICFDARIYF